MSLLPCRDTDNDCSIEMPFYVAQDGANVPSHLEHVVVTMTLTINTSGGPVYGYDDFFDYADGYTNIDDWLKDSHPRRGNIKVELTSPHGTKSVLLPNRDYDFINEEGYDNWPFMSVHYWGRALLGHGVFAYSSTLPMALLK